MKKLFAVILAVLCFSSTAFGEAIYEGKTETVVTKGVIHQSVDTFTETGWVQANILRIDLTDENLEIKVMTSPNGSSSLSTVKTMAESYNAKAAVNADFFNMQSGETNMLGMVYQDGEMVSTPSKDNLASFIITEENEVILDYFTYSGTLYAENTSLTELSSCELYQINKVPLTTGAITMITSDWGENVSVPAYCYAMITEPYDKDMYKMTGFSWGGEKVSIPDDGAVFIANYSVNGFLNANFATGDVIRVENTISPNIEKIKEASGGNTLIVKDGKVCEFTNNITGRAQRTALGIADSGKTLVLVTIDGRLNECPGFNQTELANFMIYIGCDKAINLDGGGSTTMVTEDRFTGKQTVQNTVSSLRSVSTGLGIISHAAPGETSGAEIMLSADAVVAGDTVEVYAAFYDDSYNSVYADLGKVTFSSSDKNAIINGNKITFKTAGEHTIRAEYDGVVLETKLQAVDDFFAINIYPENANTKKSDVTFTVTGYDRNGTAVTIPPSLVTFETEGNITMSGSTVKKGNGTGIVTAKYKNLTSNAVVNGEKHANKTDVKGKDIYEGIIENGEKIVITGSINTPDNLLGGLQIKKRLKELSAFDKVYSLSNIFDPWGDLTEYEKLDGFTEKTVENTKIVTIANTKSNSIRLTDTSAWGKFKAVCKTLTEKNLVLITNNPVYNMNEKEQEVFDHYMKILTDKGINVFVVSMGEKSEATVKNGVRYLYIGSITTPSYESFEYGLTSSTPLTLTFKGDEIMYEYR